VKRKRLLRNGIENANVRGVLLLLVYEGNEKREESGTVPIDD